MKNVRLTCVSEVFIITEQKNTEKSELNILLVNCKKKVQKNNEKYKQRKIKQTNESKRIFNGFSHFFHSVLFGTEKHEKQNYATLSNKSLMVLNIMRENSSEQQQNARKTLG